MKKSDIQTLQIISLPFIESFIESNVRKLKSKKKEKMKTFIHFISWEKKRKKKVEDGNLQSNKVVMVGPPMLYNS